MAHDVCRRNKQPAFQCVEVGMGVLIQCCAKRSNTVTYLIKRYWKYGLVFIQWNTRKLVTVGVCILQWIMGCINNVKVAIYVNKLFCFDRTNKYFTNFWRNFICLQSCLLRLLRIVCIEKQNANLYFKIWDRNSEHKNQPVVSPYHVYFYSSSITASSGGREYSFSNNMTVIFCSSSCNL